MLQDKNILLGITGSIAAYKVPSLIRLLKKNGANVQVIMTESAKAFVTPLTLSTVSNNPVYCEAFDPKTGAWNSHIELALWADLILLAPLSANTIGKMVNGIADNLLLTTYLSARSKVMIAPAMDLDMYKHPSTKRNIETLVSWGHQLIEPTEGELASGLCGAGRMESPENILEAVNLFLEKKSKLTGKKALISAGPTYESIDAVRFLGNYSSGKMGFCLAQEFANRGAIVTLITGPVSLSTPKGIKQRINIVSAEEMLEACKKEFFENEIIIMSAAVADFTPKEVLPKKIKKETSFSKIELKETKDILKTLGEIKKKNQFLVGFALETDDEIQNAIKKIHSKNLDLIVLNSMNDKGAGFGFDTNTVTLIDKNEHPQAFELKSKKIVASDIADKIESMLYD